MWIAKIVYDADGTQPIELTGERISSSVTPNGDGTCRALVIAFNIEGEPTEVFQCSRIYSIVKQRHPNPPSCTPTDG